MIIYIYIYIYILLAVEHVRELEREKGRKTIQKIKMISFGRGMESSELIHHWTNIKSNLFIYIYIYIYIYIILWYWDHIRLQVKTDANSSRLLVMGREVNRNDLLRTLATPRTRQISDNNSNFHCNMIM